MTAPPPQPLTEAELEELEAAERAARETEAEMVRVGKQHGAVAAYIDLGGKLREARNSLYVRALEQMGRVLAELRAARALRAELTPLVEAVRVAHRDVTEAARLSEGAVGDDTFGRKMAREQILRSVKDRACRALADAYIAATTARAGDGEEGSK